MNSDSREAADCIGSYVQNIMDCYSDLSKFCDLKPSPEINTSFERLVSLCTQTPDESVTAKVHLTPLNDIAFLIVS